MDYEIAPATIRNRILEAVMNRLMNVVDNSYVRFDETNTLLCNDEVTVEGTYPDDTAPRVFHFEVTDVDEVKYWETIKDDEAIVPASETTVSGLVSDTLYDIYDTGMQFKIVFPDELVVGEKFEIRFNTCTASLRGVYRWERISQNVINPSMVIFPDKELKARIPVDRYECDLKIALTLWIDAEPECYSYFEELLGDIITELGRDVKFGDCLNYDSTVTDIVIEDADGVSERIGAYIELHTKYRHDARDARIARN